MTGDSDPSVSTGPRAVVLGCSRPPVAQQVALRCVSGTPATCDLLRFISLLGGFVLERRDLPFFVFGPCVVLVRRRNFPSPAVCGGTKAKFFQSAGVRGSVTKAKFSKPPVRGNG
jgi:hypothetical protein